MTIQLLKTRIYHFLNSFSVKSEDDKMSILSVNYLRKGDSIYYYTLSGAVVLLLVSAACGAIWLCRKQVKLKKVEDGFSVPAPATLF